MRAESYHMEKYEGADKLVAKMNFSENLLMQIIRRLERNMY